MQPPMQPPMQVPVRHPPPLPPQHPLLHAPQPSPYSYAMPRSAPPQYHAVACHSSAASFPSSWVVAPPGSLAVPPAVPPNPCTSHAALDPTAAPAASAMGAGLQPPESAAPVSSTAVANELADRQEAARMMLKAAQRP